MTRLRTSALEANDGMAPGESLRGEKLPGLREIFRLSLNHFLS